MRLGEATVEIHAATDQLRQGLGEAENQVTSTMGSIHEKMMTISKVAGGVLLGLGAAVAGLGVIGTVTAMDMEKGQSRVQAALGLTEDKAKEVGGAAQEAWKMGFGESIEDATEQVRIIGQTMGDFSSRSQQEIADLTTSVLAIGDAFDQDTREISNSVRSLTQNFKGLSEQEALDLITYGFQNGANASDDLLDTLTEYSPQFAALGFSSDQFMSTLIQGAQSGAYNMDVVGDAVKELRLRMTDMSDEAIEVLESVGLNAEELEDSFNKGGDAAQEALKTVVDKLNETEDKTLQNKLGLELFGVKWEDLAPQVATAIDVMDKGLDGVEGSTDKLKDNLKSNISDQWEIIKRSAQSALGEIMLPLIQDATPHIETMAKGFQKVAEGTKKFMDKWKESGSFMDTFDKFFSEDTKQIIFLVAGAIGGIMVFAIYSLATSLFALAPAIWAAITPILPFIAIGMAVAALAYLIWDNWDFLVEMLGAAWEWIKSTAMKTFTILAAFFRVHWAMMKKIFGPPVKWIVDLVMKNWELVKTVSSKVWNKISSSLEKVWNGIKSVASNVWGSIWGTIKGMLNNSIGGINTLIRGLNKVIEGTNKVSGSGIPKVPQIPKLAKGGIITGPTLAMVGEGRHSEAVLPLSDKVFSELGQGIANHLSGKVGDKQEVIVNVMLDGKQIYPIIRKELRSDLTGSLGGAR